jgi:hypothetical protein
MRIANENPIPGSQAARRRISQLTAARVFFTVLAPGSLAIFAMNLAAGKTAGTLWSAMSVVCAVALIASQTVAIRRLRAAVTTKRS